MDVLLTSWVFWFWSICFIVSLFLSSNAIKHAGMQARTGILILRHGLFASVFALVGGAAAWICFQFYSTNYDDSVVYWVSASFLYMIFNYFIVSGNGRESRNMAIMEYNLRKSEQAFEHARRESVRCKACGAEEAIELVSSQVLGRENRRESVMREMRELRYVTNPNYLRHLPNRDGLPLIDYREKSEEEAYSAYSEQVDVQYTSMRLIYGCRYCKQAWPVDQIYRNVP